MRYGSLLAGILLGVSLLLPAPQGEAARYDDDEIVSVVKGDEDLLEKPAGEPARPEQKSSQPDQVTDKSRAGEQLEQPEEIRETGKKAREDRKDRKAADERYIKVAAESGYVYYLDTQTAKWRYLPYSASEKILDVWVKLVHEGAGDYDDGEGYSYPETYFMEHYYLRTDRQQIQFLCELEVTGRPQNAIKERDYSPANWENLVPGSIEDDIYHTAVTYMKKSKKFGMTRHGQNITVRDALEEFGRISL